MEQLHQYIKSQIYNCHQVVNITSLDNIQYRIEFIAIEWRDRKPNFSIEYQNLNLRVQIRDSKIQELLNSIGKETSDFDVEDIIYSEEEREKLHKLH